MRSSTAPPGPTSTAPRTTSEARWRPTATGAGHVAQRGRRGRRLDVHFSTDYVFDGAKREPYLESDPADPVVGLRAHEARGRARGGRRAPDAHTIVRSSWLFGTGGACFPKTMLRAGRPSATSSTVVDDQIGCPTFTGHLAPALVRARRATAIAGDAARRRRPASARGPSSRVAIFDGRPAWPARCARSTPASTRRRRRARPTACCAPSAARPSCPTWREGLREFMTLNAAGGGDEAAGVRRRRLHRLELRRPAGARARRRGDRARQAHLRRAAREPRDGRARVPLRPRRDRGSGRGRARRSPGARRSSTSPPRRTSTARSPSPMRSS